MIAPERIWAAKDRRSGVWDAGTFCASDDGGKEYARADLLAEAQAEIARLAAEVARLELENSSLRDSRRHHRDKAIGAKGRVDRLRKRKAALMAALLQVLSSDDLSKAKFVARIAHDGWEDEEMIFNGRAALASSSARRRAGL